MLCLIFAGLSVPVWSNLDDSAVPVTVDFLDNTSDTAVPVIVDGAFSSPTEQDRGAMGYNSGSLYRQFLNRSTNRFSAIVSTVQGAEGNIYPNGIRAEGNYLVASIASTRIPSGSHYAPGQKAAAVNFGLSVNGSPLPVTLYVVGAHSTENGLFEYLLDINGDGTPDMDATRYGILARAGFSALTPEGSTYFLVEMAVPDFGRYAFLSGRMSALFYTPGGTSLNISDGVVTTGVPLAGGAVGTKIDAGFVPVFISFKVGNAINLQKQGLVPVKIEALAGLDLRTIDIESIRLRDASLPKNFNGAELGGGTFYTDGARAVKDNQRVNGNSQSNLTVWFTTEDMKSLGGFTSSSPSAVLVAKTTDGKNLSGTALVRLSP